MLKRSLAFSREIHASERFKCSLPYLNVYAVGGWCEGVKYQIELLQPGSFITDVGFSRDAIVETLALAFYLAPAWGTVQTADTAMECLGVVSRSRAESSVGVPRGMGHRARGTAGWT